MKKYILWAAVILWMALIFFFSSQVAEQSDKLSAGITETIVQAIRKFVPNAKILVQSINHFVRKYAHFFEYLILGVLTVIAFRSSSVRGYKGILAAFIVCVLYAASDEIHQLFVPGRSGQFTDVLIDSAGAMIGSAIAGILRK